MMAVNEHKKSDGGYLMMVFPCYSSVKLANLMHILRSTSVSPNQCFGAGAGLPGQGPGRAS